MAIAGYLVGVPFWHFF